eukprot:12748282-Heterocapsa_arctica.AAC.1
MARTIPRGGGPYNPRPSGSMAGRLRPRTQPTLATDRLRTTPRPRLGQRWVIRADRSSASASGW